MPAKRETTQKQGMTVADAVAYADQLLAAHREIEKLRAIVTDSVRRLEAAEAEANQ